jgi:predicted flap endonuclease-1-like 5' DNA nuclease
MAVEGDQTLAAFLVDNDAVAKRLLKKVQKIDKKDTHVLFVMYEGVWTQSIGTIQDAIRADNALLITSSLPEDKAAALRALVEPAVEDLGGQEVVEEFDVVVEAEPDDLTVLTGIGPKSAEALTAAKLATYAALADANEPKIRAALAKANLTTPSTATTWPTQAKYAAEGDWHGLMKYNQKQSAAKATKASKSKAKSAKAEPAKPAKPDDLTKISGIGPRMEVIFNDGEVTTYDKLAHTSAKDLRLIVAAGGALPPSALKSWPTQAAYAMKGDWEGLTTYNARR